ncbi:MAG: 2-amino-4-hydroxy-6-hydroxymethyldihydropteridine diphosphokinase [Elusimicrobia bacterium RIFOXYA2_FULL_39_19]|nr:MAG: 2-amino-4-hydroxy-6-hydroxymethyldihydropteridine diphosphokinase [Elusimicrobia bacterium RIFOXYA2_FULL_39_19]
MVKAYIGIGTNLGNKRKNIIKAYELLNNRNDIVINSTSSSIKTKAWGYKNQPDFLNAVLEIETELQPLALLKVLKEIEKKIGRKKTFKWGPRLIDLDILTYGNKKLKTKTLTIPHPEMKNRDFVIKPLEELKNQEIE